MAHVKISVWSKLSRDELLVQMYRDQSKPEEMLSVKDNISSLQVFLGQQ